LQGGTNVIADAETLCQIEKVERATRSENQTTSLIQQGRLPIVHIAPEGKGWWLQAIVKEGSVFGLPARMILGAESFRLSAAVRYFH